MDQATWAALKQRKHQSLLWMDGNGLRIVWTDGTVSWFHGSPERLMDNDTLSDEVITDALASYAEMQLTPLSAFI